MGRTESDSGGEATETTTTTAPSPHDVAIGAPAVRKEREAREAHERAAAENAQREQAREVGAPGALVLPEIGGAERPRRLLLIGLDGAAPELAIGAWRTQLRTMHMLTDRGARGRLRSSMPWFSAPAWQSLLSGREPAQLGIYGRRQRRGYSYAAPTDLDSSDVHEPRLWDLLGGAGKQVGVVAAPATTPPQPVRGHLIGDRPVSGAPATYPPALAQLIAAWLADAPAGGSPTGGDLEQIVGDIYVRTEQRFRLARRLLARDSYGCFVVCDDGIAAIQRILWDTLDVTHSRFRPNHPLADTISLFYRFVDEQIGELLELIDSDTIVAVVSACGMQALDGELSINDWLIAQGDLALRSAPAGPTPIEQCDVDWARTRAWSGDDGAIYLNVAGREPQGTVPADQAEQALTDLSERLRAIEPPATASSSQADQSSGVPEVEIMRPPAVYSASSGVVPDLVAICARPGWRADASVGHRRAWVSTREAAMDAAYESPSGFFVIYDPHGQGKQVELDEASIYDLAPTLLALLGEPVAARLRGRAIPGL